MLWRSCGSKWDRMTSRISGRSKGVQQFAEAMSGNINENIGHGFDVSYSFSDIKISFSDIKISFSSRVFFEHEIWVLVSFLFQSSHIHSQPNLSLSHNIFSRYHTVV